MRKPVEMEVKKLIAFYERRGWSWADAAEFTLALRSGRLDYVIRTRIGAPRKESR